MKPKIPSFDAMIRNQGICLATEGRSQNTIDWYASNLRRFLQFLRNRQLPDSIEDIGIREVRDFIFYLQNEVTRWESNPYTRDGRRLSPFSVQGYVRTIKAFWSWLVAEGYIQNNPMEKLKIPKVPRKVIATFTPEQIEKMIKQLDLNKQRTFRDYTIILLLLDTGIRLSELANLRIEDVDFKQSCLLVTGKGSKERIVPIGTQVRRQLWRYSSAFRPEPYLSENTNLFLTTSGNPLKRGAIRLMISRLGVRAGISGVRCSAHTFRHTFAKQYLMQGGDIFSLQRILGHSSLEMVRVYVNLATSDVSKQHRKYSPVDNIIMAKAKR